MKKNIKHFILMAAASMLISTPALACGGTSCPSESCDFKGKKVESSEKNWAEPSAYKKTKRYNIPGNSPKYIRNILKKSAALELTDQQKKQIGALLKTAESDASKAHDVAKLTVVEFRKKMYAGGLKETEIKMYAKQMGELRAARFQSNLMASVKASRLLSDEQKSKLYGGKKIAGSNK